MKLTSLSALIVAISLLFVCGCNSGPQPEAEAPVQGKVPEVKLDSVPGDRGVAPSNTVEREGQN